MTDNSNSCDITVANQAENLLPKLEVLWDAKSGVSLKFDNEQFKTWDLVEGILRMAADKAKAIGQATQAAQMQQAMMEHQQAHELSRRLRRG